jgi:hypothetical protein
MNVIWGKGPEHTEKWSDEMISRTRTARAAKLGINQPE